MKKHKNKIIAATIIIAALAGAWFYGGNYNKSQGAAGITASTSGEQQSAPASSVKDAGAEEALLLQSSGSINNTESAASPPESQSVTTGNVATENNKAKELDTQNPQNSQELSADGGGKDTTGGEGDTPGGDGGDAFKTDTSDIPEPENKSDTAETVAQEENSSAEAPEPTQTMEINPNTGKDKYQTDPVPDGKPVPVEPQDTTTGDDSFTVTLSIRCDTISANLNLLNREKHELVPDDGIIFASASVTAYEGESVFNILQREMRRHGIHMTFRNTPIYNSAYIEAINNLYEFDVGELSGWMYCVNGWYPNYGCSRYLMQPGDVIEWRYTCDLGRDLGQDVNTIGGQRDS